jgi:hypothetical protein
MSLKMGINIDTKEMQNFGPTLLLPLDTPNGSCACATRHKGLSED